MKNLMWVAILTPFFVAGIALGVIVIGMLSGVIAVIEYIEEEFG